MFLIGRHFTIVSDHQPLSYLCSSSDLSGQYLRWALRIQEFSFDVLHRPGKLSANADTLSRYPCLPANDVVEVAADDDDLQPRLLKVRYDAQSGPPPVCLPPLIPLEAGTQTPSDWAPSVASPTAGAGAAALLTDGRAATGKGIPAGKDPRKPSVPLPWNPSCWLDDADDDDPAEPLVKQPLSAPLSHATYHRMQRDGCVLYEVFGGMCTILESMLVVGIPIRRYYYSDTGLFARKIARHRIQLLMTRYPDLLPPSAVSSTFSIP